MGRMDAGREALAQVTKSYGGSRAGREAMYILANAYYESGDWAKAQETFEAFLRKPLYDDLLADGAKIAIAACREESGDLQGAFDAYKALWEGGGHHLATRLDAAMAAARCARGLGRPDDARALYQAVVDAYPDAPAAAEAKFSLEGLGTRS
jgi:TolA-binding protein